LLGIKRKADALKDKKKTTNHLPPLDDEVIVVPDSVDELVAKIEKDKSVFEDSDGGMNMDLDDIFPNDGFRSDSSQVALKTPVHDSFVLSSDTIPLKPIGFPSSPVYRVHKAKNVDDRTKSIEIIVSDSDVLVIPDDTNSKFLGRSIYQKTPISTPASNLFEKPEKNSYGTPNPSSFKYNRKTDPPSAVSMSSTLMTKPTSTMKPPISDRVIFPGVISFDTTSDEEEGQHFTEEPIAIQSKVKTEKEPLPLKLPLKRKNGGGVMKPPQWADGPLDELEFAQINYIAEYLTSLEQPDYRMMDTPNGLLIQLKSYQRQSLAFMYDVEQTKSDCWNHPTGGLLTDEVGMGKTAVCIALMLANPGVVPPIHKPKVATANIYGIKDIERIRTKATLIVAPPSILGQWQIELKKFAPANFKILWHYGQKRHRDTDFDKYDVVLTTHGCLLNGKSKDVVWHRYLFY
jgi:hypothetical protein